MLLTALLFILGTFLELLFYLLPDLPPVPPEFDTYFDFIYNIATKSGAFLKYIYSESLLLVIYSLLILLMTFKQIFMFVMYAIHKIPVLNIR